MAEIIGNIATALEERTGTGGKPYYSFRLAENSGKGENRRTTWYDVRAQIPALEAALLSKGQAVRIRGRIDPQAFLRVSELVGCEVPSGPGATWTVVKEILKKQAAMSAALVLLTSSVEAYEFVRREKRDAA